MFLLGLEFAEETERNKTFPCLFLVAYYRLNKIMLFKYCVCYFPLGNKQDEHGVFC